MLYEHTFLRDLIHDVVVSIKRNLKVDWTQPHREEIKSAVRAAVKRVLRNRGVRREDIETLLASIMTQAEQMYEEWPEAA